MAVKLKLRRGLKADLPLLAEGELGYCTDTNELFIGTEDGNRAVSFPEPKQVTEEPLIDIDLYNGCDITYLSEDIEDVSITIPEDADNGFFSNITYRTGSLTTPISFINNSELEFKIKKLGLDISSYTPPTNKIIDLNFYCDGFQIYCYVLEE